MPLSMLPSMHAVELVMRHVPPCCGAERRTCGGVHLSCPLSQVVLKVHRCYASLLIMFSHRNYIMQCTWRVSCRSLAVLFDRQGVLLLGLRFEAPGHTSILSTDGSMPPRKPKPKNRHARRNLGAMHRYSVFKRKRTGYAHSCKRQACKHIFEYAAKQNMKTWGIAQLCGCRHAMARNFCSMQRHFGMVCGCRARRSRRWILETWVSVSAIFG